MKIAISATEGNLQAAVDPRFGRAAWFLIIDTTTGQLLEAIDNSSGKSAAHGAGIGAAALVADKGVQAVLTGKVGPKAMPVLEKANVQIVNDISGTVQDAISSFSGASGTGESKQAAQASQPAQPGTGQGKCAQGRGCGQGQGQGRGMGQGRGRGQCQR